MNALDLRLLRTFIVAARTLNFRQAAQRLYLAQPTVTAQIRQLESQLGVELFDRTSAGVRLTPAGERFLPHALRVVADYEEGLQDVAAWRQGYQGSLRILCSPLVGASTLPVMLRRFTADNPDVEVKVATADSPEIGPALASPRADFDVGLTRLNPVSTDLTAFPLYADPVLLVAPPALAAPGERPWVELLAGHTLLIRNHPVYWDDLLLTLSGMGVPLRTMAVSHVHVTKRLVEEGLGLSFLPHSAVAEELASGLLVNLPTPGLELPVAHTYVALPARRPPSPAVDAFLATLRELWPESTPS